MRNCHICLFAVLMLNTVPGHAETVVQNTPQRLEVTFDFQDAGFIVSPVAGQANALIDVFDDSCCDGDTFKLDISVSLDGGNTLDDSLIVEGLAPRGASIAFSQADFNNGLGGSSLGLEVTGLRITNDGSGWTAHLIMAESGCNVIADHSSGNLNLNFDLASNAAATWNVGAFILGNYTPFWAFPIPVIDPVFSLPLVSFPLPNLGTIAVVSFLSTPDIGCFDVELVDTSSP